MAKKVAVYARAAGVGQMTKKEIKENNKKISDIPLPDGFSGNKRHWDKGDARWVRKVPKKFQK